MATQPIQSNNHLQCGFCSQPITENLQIHHIHPKSAGGSNDTSNLIPAHSSCHRAHHSQPSQTDGLSDFQRWGKLSAADYHWSFYLRGVKDNPAYESARNFYRLYYATGQARKERQ